MRPTILFLLCLSTALAQSTNYPGSVDTDAQLFVAKDNIQTTLAAPMALSDNVAVVTSSTGWAVNMVAYICDASAAATSKCPATFEEMLVTAINGNVLTVTRAIGGTVAVAHAAGRTITNAVTASYHTAVASALKAIEKNTRGIVTPESYGCVGDGTTDDSACFQTAATQSIALGKTLWASGTYKITTGVVVNSGFRLSGGGTIKPTASSGTLTALQIQNASGLGPITKVTGDVNGNFAGRFTNASHTIVVASATGITPGTWLSLDYNDGVNRLGFPFPTRVFYQNVQVSTVAGTTITTNQSILIPMDSTQNNTVTVWPSLPALGVDVGNMTFDGSGCTGTSICGFITMFWSRFAKVHDCHFKNLIEHDPAVNQEAPVVSYQAFGTQWANLSFENAGTHNGALHSQAETQPQFSNITMTAGSNPDDSGFSLQWSIGAQVANMDISGTTSRGMRVLQSAHSTFANIHGQRCGAICLYVTWNSYNLQFDNLVLNEGTNNAGLVVGGDDEGYVTVNGLVGYANTNDVWFDTATPSGHDIQVKNYRGTQYTTPGVLTFAPRSSVVAADSPPAFFSAGCTGVATASQTLYVSVSPPGACTNTSFSQADYLLLPTGGLLHNFRASANAAGVNASSGLVTLGVVGLGSLSNLQCTIGTGTSCTADGTGVANGYYVAPGSKVYVVYTTQGGETLAGLNVSFQVN